MSIYILNLWWNRIVFYLPLDHKLRIFKLKFETGTTLKVVLKINQNCIFLFECSYCLFLQIFLKVSQLKFEISDIRVFSLHVYGVWTAILFIYIVYTSKIISTCTQKNGMIWGNLFSFVQLIPINIQIKLSLDQSPSISSLNRTFDYVTEISSILLLLQENGV